MDIFRYGVSGATLDDLYFLRQLVDNEILRREQYSHSPRFSLESVDEALPDDEPADPGLDDVEVKSRTAE